MAVKNRLLSMIICSFLIIGFIKMPVYGEKSDEAIHAMGSLPGNMEIDDPIKQPSSKSTRGLTKAGTLPSRYDARTEGLVTPIKNQGSYGTCWSFASIAAMESSLIKSGFEDDTVDLSELHEIYFMYNNNIDKKGRISEDRNYVSEDAAGTPTTNFKSMANAGGFINSAAWQAANGVIPFNENGDDYNTSAGTDNYSISQSDCFSSNYRVKNVLMCNFNEENIDNVKKLIYEYGGVAANFYCE